MASIVLFSILAIHTGCITTSKGNRESMPKFPAILIFGDSTVDAGNNNYILTPLKANHLPYGIDFPGHIPTGRYSNGEVLPDMWASMLGIKETVPPFLQPNISDDELVTGVSFASGGSGFDELTTVITRAIPMSRQTRLLKDYIQRLERIVGEKEARRIVNGALVIVSAGPNDFILNYYDLPTRRLEYDIMRYQSFLLNKLQDFVKELYDLGCHRIIISGLPPIGCLPIQLTVKSPILRRCKETENSDAITYNDRLQKLLPQMQQELPGSKILYADYYTITMDMITTPQKYGFSEVRKGCCGTGLLETGPLCTHLTPVCANHSEYLFWDSIHPGESSQRYVSQYLAKQLLPKLLSHFSSQ